MKILWQLCFLFALCLIGDMASFLLPFPFPSSVISLLILLLLLCTRVVKPEQIRESSEFLLKNMAFLFLPAGVQVMEQFSVIQSQIPVLLFIVAVTLVLTFLASAFTVTIVIRWMEKREKGGKPDGRL